MNCPRCTCKAELAAMLLEVLEVGRASSYGVDRERFDHAQPFRDMKDAVLRRLSPAPAEPQEPGVPDPGASNELTAEEAQRRRVCRFCQRSDIALPGNALVLNFGREYAHEQCLKIRGIQPAPASTPAFDAKAIADGMVRWHNGAFYLFRDGAAFSAAARFDKDLYPLDEDTLDIPNARLAIAAALTAAHAAGDAAGYARGKEEQRPGPRYEVRGALSGEVFGAFKHRHDAAEFMRNREWVEIADTQPSAPEAKEARP